LTDKDTPSIFDRYPVVGPAFAIFLGVGAVVAFVLALVTGGGGETQDGGSPPPPVTGGTLRVGVVGLSSLDPLDARDPTAVMAVDQLFDTLAAYDRDTLEPKPGLASWEANPEQTVFTFRLGEGATFHDGSPITSGDVKFTFERIARKGSQSPLVAQLEAVSGFGPFNVDGTAPDLTGVEAPDPATVVVRLDQAFSAFPAVLGHPGFGIVPKAAVETLGDRFKEAPVGSGPFRLAAAEEGRLRLQRFVGHRSAPKLDGIDLVRLADVEAAYTEFRAGRLDVAPVPPGQVASAAKRYGRRGMGPFMGLTFYAMNLKSPDLADARLRQAVSLAINRNRIVTEVYQGTVEAASGLVAEGVPERAPDACGDRCRHDPERAKVLVAEAFPGGGVPEVAVDHDDDPVQAAVAASIKADLDAAGIPSVLRSHPFAEYGQFLVSGQAELFRLGWIADFPSPDGFLHPLFLSTSPENVTGLASAEVDDRLRAARAEPDPQKRAGFYREAEAKVLEQFVVIPVAQLENRLVVAERVRSFSLTPMGTFDATVVTLAAS
jgi:oligopeptide transport system substrate-binding protein